MAGSQRCPCGAFIHSPFAVTEEHLFMFLSDDDTAVIYCSAGKYHGSVSPTSIQPTLVHNWDHRAKHYKEFPHIIWQIN